MPSRHCSRARSPWWLPTRGRRYPLACREDPERLGVRLIEGPLAGAMTPVFQTSANRSGEPPPHRFDDLAEGILAGADLAIDGGELTGAPSTVVDITRFDEDGGWKLLREGGLARIEVALGQSGARGRTAASASSSSEHSRTATRRAASTPSPRLSASPSRRGPQTRPVPDPRNPHCLVKGLEIARHAVRSQVGVGLRGEAGRGGQV